jgi:hypothetical protein
LAENLNLNLNHNSQIPETKVKCETSKVKNCLNEPLNELLNYFRTLGTVKQKANFKSGG